MNCQIEMEGRRLPLYSPCLPVLVQQLFHFRQSFMPCDVQCGKGAGCRSCNRARLEQHLHWSRSSQAYGKYQRAQSRRMGQIRIRAGPQQEADCLCIAFDDGSDQRQPAVFVIS